MAKARKAAPADLPAQRDPTATLDAAAFLRAAQPTLRRLTEDLLARADASPRVTAALKRQHAVAIKQHRTADEYIVWRRAVVTQVAAAWLLSCVFIRVLEDRGLIHARLAGPAARDSEAVFFQLTPSLTHREYLLTIFRELSRLPAAADLFDAKHNLVWRLAPSDAACKDLLALFRTPSIEAPAFRFGQPDTRFLGDLYQDLDADVREHYALFQTPPFIEPFILDHTLEPAISEYGIDHADIIDPTCGSGHFLLGAFPRLLDHLRRAYPDVDDRELARRALDKIYGVDINPYAVSIARFRLILQFIETGQFATIRNVPRVTVNVTTADSLLYGFAGGQGDLSELSEQHAEVWRDQSFQLEDPETARRILVQRNYTCVVGNPPYTTVEDPERRATYRRLYPRSAFKEYSLSAPFLERFFLLAKPGGFTGQITTNAFTKREYGKRVIETFLPTVSLHLVINADGCYIPNHGTPTVLLFGRNSPPSPGATVRVVLAKRGEDGIPADPANAVVWRTVVEHWNEPGFENDYRSVEDVPLSRLHKHAWSLEGGGKTDLKVYLESKATNQLASFVESVGFMCITKQDDAFGHPAETMKRYGIEPDHVKPFQAGETVRDWGITDDDQVIFPYTTDIRRAPPESLPNALKFLWPAQAILYSRKVYGGDDYLAAGKSWYEYGQIPADRFEQPLSIAFSEVATHNHFALDRGGKIFKQTAPLVKLPMVESEEENEANHLLLLAYLNSSTVCFLLKQVAYPKGMHNGSRANSTPFLVRFAYDGSKVKKLPLPPGISQPPHRERLVPLARRISAAQGQRNALTFGTILASVGPAPSATELESAFRRTLSRREALLTQAIALQEEIDWYIYYLFDLIEPDLRSISVDYELEPGERPFELRLAQDEPAAVTDGWFKWSQISPRYEISPRHPGPIRQVLQQRLQAIRASSRLKLLEAPEHKRRWRQPSGKAAQSLETDDKVLRDQARAWLLDRLEKHVRLHSLIAVTRREIVARALDDNLYATVLTWLESGNYSVPQFVAEGLTDASVPYLASLRMEPTGVEKATIWRTAQAMQRLADEFEAKAPTLSSFGPRTQNPSIDDDAAALREYKAFILARMEHWGVDSHPDSTEVERLSKLAESKGTSHQEDLFVAHSQEDSLRAGLVKLFSAASVPARAKSYRAGIPRPTEFEPPDFRDNYYRLRGTLDLPEERFISYPGCASDVDQEPVYGWAGWNHLQRALALFQLYYARKDEPSFTPDRLLPMLAGLEELLPWVRQWHADERSPETGQLYHEYFDQVIDSEAAELGFSRAQLADWAPPERSAGRKSAKSAKPAGDEEDAEKPAPRARKARADADADGTGEPAPARKPRKKAQDATATDTTEPAPARKRRSKSADKTPPASE